MKPVYKKVKVLMEHCPICGEQLEGNNSDFLPWWCKCGEWQAIAKYPWNGEYEIKPKF